MNTQEYYTKQIAKALQPKSSHTGFNLLITLVSSLIAAITWLVCKGIMLLAGKVKEAQEAKEAEAKLVELRDKAIKDLLVLLRVSGYDLLLEIVKSNINYKNARTSQWINLYVYSNSKNELQNINGLINTILGGDLDIVTTESELEGTIVIIDNGLEVIKDRLNELTDTNIRMRNV